MELADHYGLVRAGLRCIAIGVAHPGWVTSWDVFCTVLGPTAFRLLALVVIVVALMRRNLRVALFLVISVELVGTRHRNRQACGRPSAAGHRAGLRAVDIVSVRTRRSA